MPTDDEYQRLHDIDDQDDVDPDDEPNDVELPTLPITPATLATLVIVAVVLYLGYKWILGDGGQEAVAEDVEEEVGAGADKDDDTIDLIVE
jgi:hypothetical protein